MNETTLRNEDTLYGSLADATGAFHALLTVGLMTRGREHRELLEQLTKLRGVLYGFTGKAVAQ